MEVFSIARVFYRLSKQVPPELSKKEFDQSLNQNLLEAFKRTEGEIGELELQSR